MKTILLAIALVSKAVAPNAEIAPVTAATAAVAECPICAKAPCIAPSSPAFAVELPQPSDVTACSLVAILSRRFLSAPWSATRRLKAARQRGDSDEASRLEAALPDLIDECISAAAANPQS